MFVIVSLLFAAVAFPIWVLLSLAINWADYSKGQRLLIVLSLGAILLVWALR